eukprot:scaffold108557_cov41-Prasinocladus_malaysianus.AAC.3
MDMLAQCFCVFVPFSHLFMANEYMMSRVHAALYAHVWWFEPMPDANKDEIHGDEEDDYYGTGYDPTVPVLSPQMKLVSAFDDEMDGPSRCDPIKTGTRMMFNYDVGCPTRLLVEVEVEPLKEGTDVDSFPAVTTARQSNKRKLSQLATAPAAPASLTPLASATGLADELFPGLAEAVMSGKFGAFYIGWMHKGSYGTVELPSGREAFATKLKFSYLSQWLLAFEKAWKSWKKVVAQHGEAAAMSKLQVNILPASERVPAKDWELADGIVRLARHHATAAANGGGVPATLLSRGFAPDIGHKLTLCRLRETYPMWDRIEWISNGGYQYFLIKD